MWLLFVGTGERDDCGHAGYPLGRETEVIQLIICIIDDLTSVDDKLSE